MNTPQEASSVGDSARRRSQSHTWEAARLWAVTIRVLGIDSAVSDVHVQRTGSARTWRTQLLGIDPWGPLLAGAALVVFWLHGFGGLLTRDLALYAYAGQQFADGVPPYVAVLNRAGPLAHMVPGFGGLLAKALGTDDLLTMRVAMMALSAAAVWLTYLLGRDLSGHRGAGAVAATTLASFNPVIIYATGGPREKTTMLVLVLCALLAITHRRWGWAGAATALATLTWQPAFWLCAAAALTAAAIPPWRVNRPATLRRWMVFGGGGIAATAVVAGYFLAVGALPDFLDGFLLINATNTRQIGLLEYLVRTPSDLLHAFRWTLVLFLAGLAATLVLARRSRGATDARGRARVGAGVALVVSLLWSLLVFNGWADAVFVLPLAAAGLGGAALPLSRRLNLGGAAVVPAYALMVLLAAAATARATAHDYLTPMRTEVDAVLAAAGPDATVQSIGAPQPLVIGHLTNPTRHQMFIGGLAEYVDQTYPGGLDGFVRQIEDDRPTFITVDALEQYPWLQPVLTRDYRRIGTTEDFTWFVDRSIGDQQVQRLEQVFTRA